MIPARFDYVRATSVEAALAALTEHGEDAKLLAGGHSLLPMMKLRLATPAVLVDVSELADLRYVRVEGDTVAIGALSRHDDLVRSRELRDAVPLLPHVARLVGDPQIRHRGTLGGTLAHADPAADLPCAVLALDAVLVAQGPDGRREIAATDFFTGYFESALAPDELLVEIRVAAAPGQPWAYEKFVRRANDWAIVAAAVSGDRVALANVASTPVRAAATERALADGASAADAAALASEGLEPVEDIHADAEYRRHLARLLTRRALETSRGL